MKSLIVLVFMFLSVRSYSAQSDLKTCEGMLQPSEEVSKTDYKSQQAYVRVNALYVYEALRQMSTEQRAADASYKIFSAEYNDSKSAQEFQEKINSRLDREGFNLSEAAARSYYRKNLSAKQLEEFNKCVQNVLGTPGVFVSANMPSLKAPFTVKVSWIAPKAGSVSTSISLDIVGGAVNGLTQWTSDSILGSFDRVVVVSPHANVSRVIVTATAGGYSDSVTVEQQIPAGQDVTTRIDGMNLVGECWKVKAKGGNENAWKAYNIAKHALALIPKEPTALLCLDSALGTVKPQTALIYKQRLEALHNALSYSEVRDDQARVHRALCYCYLTKAGFENSPSELTNAKDHATAALEIWPGDEDISHCLDAVNKTKLPQ